MTIRQEEDGAGWRRQGTPKVKHKDHTSSTLVDGLDNKRMGSALSTLDLGDLAQHDNGVALHDGDAAKTLAGLEAVDDKGLLGGHDNLGNLVALEADGVLGLLATGLLADLPVDGGHADSRAGSADKGNGAVADLELSGVVHDLDLDGERLDAANGVVRLEDHDVANTGHVVLVQALDVEANVVASLGSLDRLVVHLDGEDLASAGSGGGVGGEEDNLITRADGALLHTASEHITDALDLVHARHGEAHAGVLVALGDLDEVVEGVLEGGHMHSSLLADLALHALPP